MHGNRRRSGSITGGLIIGLFVCLLFIPVTVSCMKIISAQLRFREDVQDEIAAAQLRHIMIAGDEFSVQPDRITFRYHGEYASLYFIHDHLILTPGTQIFFSDADGVSFFTRGEMIGMVLKRGDDEYERLLVHI